MEMSDFPQHVVSVLDAVDPGQLVVQRLCSHLINRLLVHAAGVVVTNFLHFRRGRTPRPARTRIDLCLGCFLGDFMERVVILFD
jgi:hypothetical protein